MRIEYVEKIVDKESQKNFGPVTLEDRQIFARQLENIRDGYDLVGKAYEDVPIYTRIALGILCIFIIPLFSERIKEKVLTGKEIIFYCKKAPLTNSIFNTCQPKVLSD